MRAASLPTCSASTPCRKQPPAREQLHLVESHLNLHIPKHVSYEFDLDADVDLKFDRDIEARNFRLIDPQQIFGHTRIERPIQVARRRQPRRYR